MKTSGKPCSISISSTKSQTLESKRKLFKSKAMLQTLKMYVNLEINVYHSWKRAPAAHRDVPAYPGIPGSRDSGK